MKKISNPYQLLLHAGLVALAVLVLLLVQDNHELRRVIADTAPPPATGPKVGTTLTPITARALDGSAEEDGERLVDLAPELRGPVRVLSALN